MSNNWTIEAQQEQQQEQQQEKQQKQLRNRIIDEMKKILYHQQIQRAANLAVHSTIERDSRNVNIAHSSSYRAMMPPLSADTSNEALCYLPQLLHNTDVLNNMPALPNNLSRTCPPTWPALRSSATHPSREAMLLLQEHLSSSRTFALSAAAQSTVACVAPSPRLANDTLLLRQGNSLSEPTMKPFAPLQSEQDGVHMRTKQDNEPSPLTGTHCTPRQLCTTNDRLTLIDRPQKGEYPPVSSAWSSSATTSLTRRRDDLVQDCIAARNISSFAVQNAASVQMPSPQLPTDPPLRRETKTGLELAADPSISFRFEQGGIQLRKKRGAEPFPTVLHRVLLYLDDTAGGKAIASFRPDGRSFQIANQYLLEKSILPIFFPKMTTFASFQRQLNLYNFQRVNGTGIYRGVYRHDMFERDNPDLVKEMKRTRIKGNTAGAARRAAMKSSSAPPLP